MFERDLKKKIRPAILKKNRKKWICLDPAPVWEVLDIELLITEVWDFYLFSGVTFFFCHKTSHPNIAQKSSKNRPKVIQKLTRHRSKIVQNHPNVLLVTPYNRLLDPLELAGTHLER